MDNTANRSSDSRHHAKTDTHVGKLAGTFISSSILRNIKSTLLLIGISFLLPLRSLCLRINDNLLSGSLRCNNFCLLMKPCLRNVCILTEVQFLKSLILHITVGFYHGRYVEPLKGNTIIQKIGYQLLMNIF